MIKNTIIKNNRRRWFATLILWAYLPIGFAENQLGTALVTESDFLAAVPIVLSVSRLPQPISEAPAAVTVIDQEMIRASGFREVADLFRLVPGFYVAHSSGNWPVVSYHGLANSYARRMQVLIDGRSVYTPLFGGVVWSALPLAIEDIERIEVTRGPNAATYGANSFLGVINIITRHPSQDKAGSAILKLGENGIRDGTLRYGGALHDLDYRLTLGYRSDDGFNDEADGKRTRFFNMRGDYRFTSRDNLQFQIGWSHDGLDPGVDPCFLDCLRTQQLRSHVEQVRWQRTVNESNEISVQFFHDYLKDDESALTGVIPQPDGTRPQFFLNDIRTARRYDLEFQQTLIFPDQWRVVWGASWRKDEVTGGLLFNTDNAMRDILLRLFGHIEWRATPSLLLHAGAMLEKDSMTGTDISPRVALNYLFTPNHSVRASVSRALRNPLIFEERSNVRIPLGVFLLQGYLSGGGLRPERITSRELGYIGRFPTAGVTLDVRAFHDRIEDIISVYSYPYTPAYNGQTLGFRNQDIASLRGVETQVKFRPSKADELVFNYSHTRAVSTNSEVERSVPINILSALATHRFPEKVYASLGYYQMSKVAAIGDGLPVPVSRRLDLRLAKRFKTTQGENELAFTVQNGLAAYQEFKPSNVFDRRAFLSLTLAF